MKRNSILCLAVAMVLVLAVAGCDKSGTVPVEGTLTYEGQPVAGLHLQFNPVDGDRVSQGFTDEEGHFVLNASITAEGAEIGKHEVTCIFISNATEEGLKATPAIQAIDSQRASCTPWWCSPTNRTLASLGSTLRRPKPQRASSPC